MPTEVQEETLTLEEILAGLKEMHRLILWNDDHNTFDHVIFGSLPQDPSAGGVDRECGIVNR